MLYSATSTRSPIRSAPTSSIDGSTTAVAMLCLWCAAGCSAGQDVSCGLALFHVKHSCDCWKEQSNGQAPSV